MKYRYTVTLLFTILLSFLSSFSAEKQDIPEQKRNYRLGIFGGNNHIWNNTKLKALPCSPDCGLFENGEANALYLGINLGYHLLDDIFIADFRLTYDKRPVYLQTQTSTYQVLDPNSNSYVPLVREHTYDGSLQYLSIDIGLKHRLLAYLPISQINSLPLYLRLGFDIGNPLGGTTYTVSEKILKPSGVAFPDGSAKHDLEQGNIDDAGTNYGINAALNYDIEVGKNLYVSPEISYRHGINSVLSSQDWHTNLLRFGLALTWNFGTDNRLPERPTVQTVEKNIPNKKKLAVQIEKENDTNIIKNFEVLPVNLLETVVTQTYPLLPYIFFDSSKSEIKSKYLNLTEISSFDETSLPKETLEIYYNLLDIIGHRLQKYSNARLSINGVTDGKELENDSLRIILAQKRAYSVRDYLSSHWSIDTNRFDISYSDKPVHATSEEYLEGLEENRRVELFSTNHNVLAPVIHYKFLEYNSNHDHVEFNISLIGENDIESWTIDVFSENKNINQLSGYSVEKLVKQNLYSNNINQLAHLYNNNITIQSKLRIVLKNGKTYERVIDLNIDKSQNNFEIVRLNLIVFDFDKSAISIFNKKMIKNFIANSIQDKSELYIVGSTDRLGEEKYNKLLSSDRAESVETYIRAVKDRVDIKEVKGVGGSKLIYDNSLPEGRFYCRTVKVEVKTKLK